MKACPRYLLMFLHKGGVVWPSALCGLSREGTLLKIGIPIGFAYIVQSPIRPM